MTAILFNSAFLFLFGWLAGATFKGLNPFKMILGFIVIISVAVPLAEQDNILLTAVFVIGFIYPFANPFRWLLSIFSELKMSVQLAKARRKFNENTEKIYQQTEDYIHEESDNINRKQAQAEEAIKEGYERAKADIKKDQEKLKREKEAFRRQQANSQNNSNKKQKQDLGLNPKNFADACNILGVKQDASLKECKKAYRHLSSMFHPDKFAQFEGVLKKQAEENYKSVNVAWETLKKLNKI